MEKKPFLKAGHYKVKFLLSLSSSIHPPPLTLERWLSSKEYDRLLFQRT